MKNALGTTHNDYSSLFARAKTQFFSDSHLENLEIKAHEYVWTPHDCGPQKTLTFRLVHTQSSQSSQFVEMTNYIFLPLNGISSFWSRYAYNRFCDSDVSVSPDFGVAVCSAI